MGMVGVGDVGGGDCENVVVVSKKLINKPSFNLTYGKRTDENALRTGRTSTLF